MTASAPLSHGPMTISASMDNPCPAAASVRCQLARLLQNRLFADSQRMARFLEFAVLETLNGNARQLKETVIGVHVFDRSSDYDSRIDPIVRVEARRLRLKLQAYYDGDGREDDLVIELPKGSYSPLFRLRSEQHSQVRPRQTNTIAVLPFVNLSPEPELEFISDGLTEDLISALTRVSNLHVSAWTSAARIKTEGHNLDAVRDLLGVCYVLRGSVRKTDDRIRIVTHLIDTTTRQYLWSGTFDRHLHDIIYLQDDITQALVVALEAQSTPLRVTPASNRKAHSSESYQLYLKGRFHSRERTQHGLERSVVCFEKAIEISPRFGSAHAGLADTFTLQVDYGFADGPETMRKAKAAVERALELDPTSGEAHASLGLILSLYDWAWENAESAFQQSLRLNNSYAAAHYWYAIDHLAMLGRFDESRRELDAAARLDPLSPPVLEGGGYLHLLCREYRQALAAYERILAIDPSYPKAYASMGRAWLHLGDLGQAIALFEKSLSLTGEVVSTLGGLGQAYGLAGNRAKALRILERLHTLAENRSVRSTAYAIVHLGLKEQDAALEWLSTGVLRHECSIAALRVHPAYDDLRQDPRFQSLAEQVIPQALVLP